MKTYKLKLLILITTIVIAWVLGVFRFEYEWALIIYKIVLFPFGFIYLLHESYYINNLSSSHFFNNEFFQLFVFGITTVLQAYLFYFLIRKMKFSK